jgi:hypothetical protein
VSPVHLPPTARSPPPPPSQKRLSPNHPTPHTPCKIFLYPAWPVKLFLPPSFRYPAAKRKTIFLNIPTYLPAVMPKPPSTAMAFLRQHCHHHPRPNNIHAIVRSRISRTRTSTRLYSTAPEGAQATKPKSPHAALYSDILPSMVPIFILGSAVYLVRPPICQPLSFPDVSHRLTSTPTAPHPMPVSFHRLLGFDKFIDKLHP